MPWLILSQHCIGIQRIAMPAMNFDQPWRYPEAAYERYHCIVSVHEAMDLLRDQLDDIVFFMQEDVVERVASGEPISTISSSLCALGWPKWQTLTPNIMGQVLAEESAMEILLELEMKYSSLPPIAQLRTINEARVNRHRIVIAGRAVRYDQTQQPKQGDR